MWSALNNFRNGALLFLRVAMGGFYIWLHGWSRLAGGIATWKKLGLPMKQIGITFFPEFWGFMVAFASTVAVILVILGFAFRPACLLILVTLGIAIVIGIESSGIAKTSHLIELAILVASLIFIGPGRYSFDKS